MISIKMNSAMVKMFVWNLICGSLLFLFSTVVFAAGERTVSEDTYLNLQGKGGVFLRPSIQTRKFPKKRELMLGHPLIDAVFLPYSWRQLEPQKGQYQFDAMLREIETWGKAGKKVIATIALYGQHPDDGLTPPWIYEESGVRAIQFEGGGIARGEQIRIPAVWDEGFAEKYIQPLIREFAQALAGNPYVAFVMPGFGHIGNITCQPSPDGGRAVLESGWTAEQWIHYCVLLASMYKSEFNDTPMLLTASGAFLRDRENKHYATESNQLIAVLARMGISPIVFGLEGDAARMKNVYKSLEQLLPLANTGSILLGMGDDWPLWVPEHRRTQGPTRGHDDDNLKQTLENAFRDEERGVDIPTTILLFQEPEMLASHPGSYEYQLIVYDLIQAARQRVQDNDHVLFP